MTGEPPEGTIAKILSGVPADNSQVILRQQLGNFEDAKLEADAAKKLEKACSDLGKAYKNDELSKAKKGTLPPPCPDPHRDA